jgi:hypothetical protein
MLSIFETRNNWTVYINKDGGRNMENVNKRVEKQLIL